MIHDVIGVLFDINTPPPQESIAKISNYYFRSSFEQFIRVRGP
jgi:hypothetical protein